MDGCVSISKFPWHMQRPEGGVQIVAEQISTSRAPRARPCISNRPLNTSNTRKRGFSFCRDRNSIIIASCRNNDNALRCSSPERTEMKDTKNERKTVRKPREGWRDGIHKLFPLAYSHTVLDNYLQPIIIPTI